MFGSSLDWKEVSSDRGWLHYMGVLSAMRDMKNIDAVKEVKFCAKQFIDSLQCPECD